MKKYVVIDIGGTMIKYGLVDEAGNLLEKAKRTTEAELGGRGIMAKVCSIIDSYQMKYSLAGICLSSAGMVDPEKGEIFYSGPAIPDYAGTKYKEVLEAKYLLPCEIENDVNCAGLAEVFSGAAKNSKITVCLTIGTGIGGSLLIGNQLFHGFSNSACEIGYLKMADSTFQELASTTALVDYVSKGQKINTEQWDGYRIFEEAKMGNQQCIAAIDRMVDYLGQGIATICYVINPETVVLGGGIMAQKEYLARKIETAVNKHLLSSLATKTKITFAHHENDAGLLGAYYHFRNRHTEDD
ncbi:ROK family protein [Enterococcus dongliensis]|uniref:ROK family protein n=1 Tax=Enterococcus dongliensis TaxID=2559925 RepID=A0AAP5KQR8_9ENTE|nr:ROK family protein [Enterococcus dongliensis]MDT2596639.1 ROK family protein [Enterococcus dongliensis]MDT2604166.1 ROK family protein [Enterococcus dongliensis]MDT2634642.1 ROK family protein [Enterococcus dongliensis]MDT2637534.1 ROK family protein [Enterococcus dongliensis]MDT2640139.1 ROK family protein [Enterococcus dongliensis]